MTWLNRFLTNNGTLVSLSVITGALITVILISLLGYPSSIAFAGFTFRLPGIGVETIEVTRLVEVAREVTRLVEVTRMVEATRLVEVAADQSTPQPANTTEANLVEVPTATPTPTNVISAETGTSNQSIQPVGFVFTDDFERGPDPAWRVVYGTMGMANGMYTITSPFDRNQSMQALAILDNHYWSNVAITINLASFTEAYDGRGSIIVRHQLDDQSGVALVLYSNNNGIAFAQYDRARNWTIHSGSLVTGREGNFNFSGRSSNIKVEAYGDTYFAYIDDRQITSATIPGRQSGYVGLWAQTSSYNSRVENFTARFEDIHVESLP